MQLQGSIVDAALLGISRIKVSIHACMKNQLQTRGGYGRALQTAERRVIKCQHLLFSTSSLQ